MPAPVAPPAPARALAPPPPPVAGSTSELTETYRNAQRQLDAALMRKAAQPGSFSDAGSQAAFVLLVARHLPALVNSLTDTTTQSLPQTPPPQVSGSPAESEGRGASTTETLPAAPRAADTVLPVPEQIGADRYTTPAAEHNPTVMLSRGLTPDDFKIKPTFAGPEAEAKERVWNEVKGIVEELATPRFKKKAGRTTYSVAEVETADGRRELWITGAGKDFYVHPGLKTEEMKVKSRNLHPDGKPGNNLNDAESKLIRQAEAEGARIKAIGATREMCPTCQGAAKDAGIPEEAIVTPKETIRS